METDSSIYQIQNSSQVYKLTKSYYINYTFPIHLHSDIEIIYVMDGDLDVTVDQNTITLHQGELLFVFPYQLHRFTTKQHSRCYIWVFSQDLIPTFSMAISHKFCKSPVINTKKISTALNTLISDNISLFELQSVLYQICSQLNNDCFIPSVADKNNTLIHQIMIYCIENYRDNISLKKFADKNGYNIKYCSQCFHSVTMINFREFLNLIRIQRSKELLLQTKDSITDIAFECGFQNIRSFNRAFLASNSLSPRDFRKHGTSPGLLYKSDEIGVHQIYQYNPQDIYS